MQDYIIDESDFYRNMNKDLETNRAEKYLPFIKTL